MRKFLIEGERQTNSRIVHEGKSRAEVLARLQPGYSVVGELLDNTEVRPPLPDGLKHYTPLTALLRLHGEELSEWLAEQGFMRVKEVGHAEGSDKAAS